MWYSSNGIAIYNIVNGLVASTTLAIVYNYDVKEITKYPCAIISVKDGDEEELDTKNNLLKTRYIIRVQDQNVSVATMEARMRTLCDSILAELRKKANQTISW
jgi:ABC-type enterochelin transport system ATPase subunit